MTKKTTLKLVYSALCLALAMVLPFLTGQIPQVGQMLSPLHIPALLCGFLCGWPYGLAVGFIAPLMRSMIFTMPPMYPAAIAMAFEMAVYGMIAGLLYKRLPKKIPYIYVSLITAMIGGRIVWGIARFVLAGLGGSSFPIEMFIGGAFLEVIPGIILHIVLIPVIVMALRKANLIPNE